MRTAQSIRREIQAAKEAEKRKTVKSLVGKGLAVQGVYPAYYRPEFVVEWAGSDGLQVLDRCYILPESRFCGAATIDFAPDVPPGAAHVHGKSHDRSAGTVFRLRDNGRTVTGVIKPTGKIVGCIWGREVGPFFAHEKWWISYMTAAAPFDQAPLSNDACALLEDLGAIFDKNNITHIHKENLQTSAA